MLRVRALDVQPQSLDETTRSFDCVLATEDPVVSIEMGSYYSVLSILRMDGCQIAEGMQIPILDVHDYFSTDKQHGSVRGLKVQGRTLVGRGYISAAAEAVWTKIKEGHLKDVSVRAKPLEVTVVRAGTSGVVAGKTYKAPKDRDLVVTTRWQPIELSLTPIGADPRAKIRSHERTNPMNEDKKAEGAAVADQTVTPPAADIQRSAAPTPPAPAIPPVSADVIRAAADAAIATERTRIRELTALAGGDVPDQVRTQAITEGWDLARASAEFLKAVRAARPAAVAPAAHVAQGAHALAMEAAFCRSAGLRDLKKHFKPEVLESADKHYRNLGLQEVLLHHARMGGYAGRERVGTDNLRDVLRSAFSTHTITTMLTTTGNKLLLEGFNLIPQSWREVAAVRSVSDFKTVTAFRMTADLEYEEVGPGGEITHGTLGQESYEMKAKTYAKMLALTRQDIINDDLGAFNDLRNRLGLGAAIKMNKVFWTLWLVTKSGAAFWTAARGNLVTGSALGETGLATAVQAFRDLAGPDGNLLGLQPDRVLVPSALEVTAKKLFVSQEVRDTTASTKTLTANIYQNQFRPVIVPECGNESYTGYSATTWYLLTNPAVLACAVMCFLNGQESPTIESADADFNTLGIQARGYHDFGAAMSEYRAGVQADA